MSSRIFISHSSRDRDMAYRLIADLERRGIPCWISSRDIEPGEDYQKSIVDALESAPAMVLLFSDHANNSKEIPREMAIASGKSKPVIPVRIEDVVPRDALAYSLTNAQFLDLFANFDDTMSRLADKLQRQILASQLELNQQPPAPAPAPAPASAAFRSVSGQSAAKTAAPAAPSKAGSRKGIYIGAGAAVLLVCIGGAAFTFNSEHATAPARQQAAAVTASPARTVAPAPEKSAEPPAVKQTARADSAPSIPPAGSLDELVAQVRQLSPGNRSEALQTSPLLEQQKLSPTQMTTLLSGSVNSARAGLISNLVEYVQRPVTTEDALKMLNGTGDSWAAGVESLQTALPEALSDKEVLALLGNTTNSRRASLLAKLSGGAKAPFEIGTVTAMLRPTGDSRSSALRSIIDLLPHPLPESAFDPLLQTIRNSSRAGVIEALQPALASSVSLDGALALLQGTGDSWISALTTLAPKLPENMTPADATRLLGASANSSRVRGVEAIAPHIASGLKGGDLVSVLRGSADSWYSGLVLLIPHLAPGQDIDSLIALSGPTKDSTRARAIEALANVLPQTLSVDEALKLLNGTGDSRFTAAQVLLPHLSRLNQHDFDAIAAGMSNSQRQRLLGR